MYDFLEDVALYLVFLLFILFVIIKVDNNYEETKNKCESLGGIYTHSYCIDKNSNILIEDFYVGVEK